MISRGYTLTLTLSLPACSRQASSEREFMDGHQLEYKLDFEEENR